jgi:hypothetical protein
MRCKVKSTIFCTWAVSEKSGKVQFRQHMKYNWLICSKIKFAEQFLVCISKYQISLNSGHYIQGWNRRAIIHDHLITHSYYALCAKKTKDLYTFRLFGSPLQKHVCILKIKDQNQLFITILSRILYHLISSKTEHTIDQCFSTFFWTWHTIFCRESSRHTNVRVGNTVGDSGLHAQFTFSIRYQQLFVNSQNFGQTAHFD